MGACVWRRKAAGSCGKQSLSQNILCAQKKGKEGEEEKRIPLVEVFILTMIEV